MRGEDRSVLVLAALLAISRLHSVKPDRNYLFWAALPLMILLGPAVLLGVVFYFVAMIPLTFYGIWQFRDWDKDPNW